MEDKEIDELLEVAKKKHGIKIKDDSNLRSLIRLIYHRAYAEIYSELKGNKK